MTLLLHAKLNAKQSTHDPNRMLTLALYLEKGLFMGHMYTYSQMKLPA